MTKYIIPIPTSTFVNAKGMITFGDGNVSLKYAGKRVNIPLSGDIKDIATIRDRIKSLQKMVSPWNVPIPALKHLEKALDKYIEKRDPLAVVKIYLESIKNVGIIDEDQYLKALENLGGAS